MSKARTRTEPHVRGRRNPSSAQRWRSDSAGNRRNLDRLVGASGSPKKKLKIVVASRKGLCDIDAMKNEQGMSEIAKIETRFLAWARAHGLNHKVAGDTAYSSRAMGMGRYAKLVSAKGGQLLIAVDGKRVTA